MEWRRGRAYGQDLRDKMFAAIDRGIEPVEVDLAADLKLRPDRVVLQIRREQTDGGSNARIGRHDHLAKAEHGGNFDSM